MGDRSGIEWTDATWNPVTGCNKVSEGCKNCYAEKMAKRLQAMGAPRYANGFKVTLHPDVLTKPLHWTRPRRVFVDSMADLFHPEVPFEFIDKLFGVMALAQWHVFQVLTKRPERMRAYFTEKDARGWRAQSRIYAAVRETEMPPGKFASECGWPLKNVWLGVSVENQRRADERIPLLLQTPAAVRFLSCEPLLGPLDLTPHLGEIRVCDNPRHGQLCPEGVTKAADGTILCRYCKRPVERIRPLHLIIAGGESGPGARPMDPEWARSLRDQCEESGTPFFFKQWGGTRVAAGGHEEALLDGALWKQMPATAMP